MVDINGNALTVGDKVCYIYGKNSLAELRIGNITKIYPSIKYDVEEEARDTRGCLIIHGTGMDMGFALQNKLHSVAYVEGYPDMFDRDYYTYLGKLSHGEYPYKRVA